MLIQKQNETLTTFLLYFTVASVASVVVVTTSRVWNSQIELWRSRRTSRDLEDVMRVSSRATW